MKINASLFLVFLILSVFLVSYEWFERGFIFAVTLLPIIGRMLWKIIKGEFLTVICKTDFFCCTPAFAFAFFHLLASTPLLKDGYIESQQKALIYILNGNYALCDASYDRLKPLVDSGRAACMQQSTVDEMNFVSDVQQERLNAGSYIIELNNKINKKQHVNKCEKDYLKLNELCPSEYPAVQFPH